jgi:hypothetical protein
MEFCFRCHCASLQPRIHALNGFRAEFLAYPQLRMGLSVETKQPEELYN